MLFLKTLLFCLLTALFFGLPIARRQLHCIIGRILPASPAMKRPLVKLYATVRASHFSVLARFRVCDLKFFDRQALDMDKAQERKVETAFFREDFRRVAHDEVGAIYESPRVGEGYSEAFLNEITHRKEVLDRKFKIVVNFSHGTAAQFLPQLLNTVGVELVSINGVVSENVGSRSFEEF